MKKNIIMQLLSITSLMLLAIACNNAVKGTKDRIDNNITTLYYDLYNYDGLIKKNAVIVESSKTADTSFIVIHGFDKDEIVFKQRLTDYGIFRSSQSSEYYLTHFFNARSSIESFLPDKYPVFANSVTSLYKKKQYLFGSADSLEVIFFEEAIPAYTYTASYFSRRLGLFIIYYNIREDYYYKLSSASEELKINMNDLLKVQSQIMNDTAFFAKFLKDKLPDTPPPPQN